MYEEDGPHLLTALEQLIYVAAAGWERSKRGTYLLFSFLPEVVKCCWSWCPRVEESGPGHLEGSDPAASRGSSLYQRNPNTSSFQRTFLVRFFTTFRF